MTRCIIVANMTTPAMGWGIRAPGLRAEQLANLAKLVFDEVTTLLFTERYNLLRRDRGFGLLTRARPDVTLIEAADFRTFAARLPPSVFVFTQAEFADQAVAAADRHRIVYDILAPRYLELEYAGATPQSIARHHRQHARMLACSTRVLVNGPKSMRLFSADLEGRDAVLCPFAPRASNVPPAQRSLLLFGGQAQRWTDVGPSRSALAEALGARPDIDALMLAEPIENDHGHAQAQSDLFQMRNVVALWNLSGLNYEEAMARSYCFIDWTPLNAERVHATSTRVLQAVASGLPVLHPSGTALDEFWSQFPGKLVGERLTSDDVTSFADAARDGAYTALVDAAAAVLHAARTDRAMFEGIA